jgi:hypothetical protein
MQLIYIEGKYINQYDSIANGYNLENTIEEVLSDKKVIMKKNMDAIYLKNLIKNDGLNANYSTNPNNIKRKTRLDNKILNCPDTYLKLRQEKYKMKFSQDKIYEELFLKDVFIKLSYNTYKVKEEYIDQGYFENGRKKKYKDGSINYVILITEKGKQFIIDTLELKKK